MTGKKGLDLNPPGLQEQTIHRSETLPPIRTGIWSIIISNLLAFFLQLKEQTGSVRYETTISPLSKKEIA